MLSDIFIGIRPPPPPFALGQWSVVVASLIIILSMTDGSEQRVMDCNARKVVLLHKKFMQIGFAF